MNRLLVVTILVISAGAAGCSRSTAADVGKLKADAQNVASMISGDNAKTQTWCQITKVYEQLHQEKDTKEVEALNQKIDELQDQLGPEYLALANAASTLDGESEDFAEIWAPINSLPCT